MAIELGDMAKDNVSGFKGICIARTEWISGCTRVTLQPTVGDDGKFTDAITFDEPMLTLLKKKAKNPGPKDVGGPRPEPARAVVRR